MKIIQHWLLFCLILIIACAKSQHMPEPEMTDFNSWWKKIDSLEAKALPRSALEETEKLYTKAKSHNEDSHLIKAILYKNKYIMQLEEEAAANALVRMEQELTEESSPVKEVLHSIMGELYRWYAQNNAYRIQNRTETNSWNPEDLKTWTLERLLDRSTEHYLASIENPEMDQYDIHFLDLVLNKYDEKAERYIKTIHEFLYYRAVLHFQQAVSLTTEPVYKFQLDGEHAFSPYEEFVAHNFETQDSTSQIFRATLLYQEILKHYEQTDNRAGLLLMDIKRLNFARQHAVHTAQDELYQKSLESIINEFPKEEETAEAYYLLANHLYGMGSRENSAELLIKAVALCKESLKKYPGSYGAAQCQNLLASLESRNLSLQTEEVQSPDLPLRFLVRYKNLSRVFVKILPISIDQMQTLDRMRNKERLNELNKIKAVTSWEQSLPDELNYRQKTAEFLSDPVGLGSYVIMVSDDPGFTDEGHAVSYSFFHVSRLSYSVLNEFDKLSVLVTDNYSGQAVRSARVEFYESYYDPAVRKNNFKLIDAQDTDARGYAASKKFTNKSMILKIIKDQDELDLRWSVYAGRFHQSTADERVHLFTDRAIYRPGQIVYFKGLVMSVQSDRFPEIVPNRKLELRFLDANHQQKQAQSFVSSEFGSFHGSFVAPESGLTGNMTLMVPGMGSTSIRVEEYKRPKFEVSIDTSKQSYVLGDSVLVTGVAKNYAGNAVVNAKVRFSVTRNTFYRWAWRGYPSSEEMQISYGTSLTDDQGRFEFTFPAKDDPSKGDHIAFSFSVNVDVTDDSGETRSGSYAYKIARKPFLFGWNLKEEMDVNEQDSISLYAENLDGQKTFARGNFEIARLREPEEVYRSRYWETPDTVLTSIEYWNRYFPFENYNKEGELKNWEELEVVQQGTFETSDLAEFKTSRDFEAGVYKLKISGTNEDGVEQKDEFIFTMHDFQQNIFPRTKNLFIQQLNGRYEPGDTVQLDFGAPDPGVAIWYALEKSGELKENQWILANPASEVSIPVEESDRGGFVIQLSWVKNNRYHHETLNITVPWSNKDLQLEFTSFRDKLIPGSKEEWSITIKGPMGDKVAAELLAGMYDASLDAFVNHSWEKVFGPSYQSRYNRMSAGFRAVSSRMLSRHWNTYPSAGKAVQLPSLNFFNLYQYFISYGHPPVMVRGSRAMEKHADMQLNEVHVMDGVAPSPEAELSNAEFKESGSGPELKGDAEDTSFSPRVNLNETVFFYPDLKTDGEGKVVLSFTMNEALTRWKLLSFAHTKEMEYAFEELEVVTQKDLMVFPNIPRFVRQGDHIELAGKVVNLTDRAIRAEVYLELEDKIHAKRLDQAFHVEQKMQTIEIPAGGSVPVRWPLVIPDDFYSLLTIRMMAKSGDHTDGEENVIPVLTNRMMVTESLPLALKANETKSFVFESLRESFESKTMVPHAFTLEYTENPVWYAIQALPYIMEFPYECSEQIFNRFYGNAIASKIVAQNPKIRQVFEQWKQYDKEALLSNLSKNEELKSALLEETPWVRQALSEEEQKKNIAMLFELNNMANSQERAISKLAARQLSNGGFAWFEGGRDNPYISQYILEGFGHLKRLDALQQGQNHSIQQILDALIPYVDDRIAEKYQRLKEHVEYSGGDMSKDHLDAYAIHYLYVRSFFQENTLAGKAKEAHDYYLGQAEKYWIAKGLYLEAMISLVLNRNDQTIASNDVMKSLLERSIRHDELGMYWKQNAGYFWYQLPVELQSLMIEAAIELQQEQAYIDAMKTWLLKMKQTTHWKTSKSTAAAIYALLMSGDVTKTSMEPYTQDGNVLIELGDKTIDLDQEQQQAGTGYFKTKWSKEEINAGMSNIEVQNDNDHINWGAVYWQYFEDLDKIRSFEETPLTLKKQLFKLITTDRGERLVPLDGNTNLEVGDKVKVRIELRVDRPMEYIHMKDMRASGLEPLNVLSGYKWQDGLGYYESTKDIATHFFFDYLPVGTYVFEYPLRVFHKGDFSNGITSIQSMYAPEFSSHSEGIRIQTSD